MGRAEDLHLDGFHCAVLTPRLAVAQTGHCRRSRCPGVGAAWRDVEVTSPQMIERSVRRSPMKTAATRSSLPVGTHKIICWRSRER